MTGMHRTNGSALQGTGHLIQSIADILTTPLGTRLERRTYGSLLPELIDHPDNGETRIRMYAAAASALMRWEPRVRITRLSIASGPRPGQATLLLDGQNMLTNQSLSGLAVALTLRGAVA